MQSFEIQMINVMLVARVREDEMRNDRSLGDHSGLPTIKNELSSLDKLGETNLTKSNLLLWHLRDFVDFLENSKAVSKMQLYRLASGIRGLVVLLGTLYVPGRGSSCYPIKATSKIMVSLLDPNSNRASGFAHLSKMCSCSADFRTVRQIRRSRSR
jgi:hypothetical protein